MYKYLLVLLLSINVSYASAVKLVEYLVSSKDLSGLIAKNGFVGDDAKQLQSYLKSSLYSLTKKENPTINDLKSALVLLPVKGKDAELRKSLQLLLNKEAKDVKQADIIEMTKNLIYFAKAHGGYAVVSCASCENTALLKKLGVDGIVAIKDASTQKLLKDVIPTNPAQLNTYISKRVNTMKLGDYSKVTADVISKEEERTFALFLGLGESGTADQKALFSAITAVSTKNGKTNMFDAKNPNKLWRIVADDMDQKEMAGWTSMLNEVAARAQRDGVTGEEAFYRILKEKADGNPELTKHYETIKAKRCFFKA